MTADGVFPDTPADLVGAAQKAGLQSARAQVRAILGVRDMERILNGWRGLTVLHGPVTEAVFQTRQDLEVALEALPEMLGGDLSDDQLEVRDCDAISTTYWWRPDPVPADRIARAAAQLTNYHSRGQWPARQLNLDAPAPSQPP